MVKALRTRVKYIDDGRVATSDNCDPRSRGPFRPDNRFIDTAPPMPRAAGAEDPPVPRVRRRLRLAAFGVAVFVATAGLWLVFVTPGFEACRRHFGHDFLAFYTAGSLAREGRHADLYDLAVMKSRQQAIARDADLALGDAVGPWWNPPIYAWVFAPLSALPFPRALAVWCGINLAAMGGAVFLLCRLVRENRGLVALLVLVSAPFLQALTHGQNTPISLLIVAAIAHAWRNRSDVVAGALVGALMYKPQLAAGLAAVLVLHRGWRAAG